MIRQHRSKRLKKRSRTAGDIVTVLVGKDDEAKSFNVYESLLCSKSPYFKAALNKEPNARVLIMDGDDANAFRLYILWLYGGKIWSAAPTHDKRAMRGKLNYAYEDLLLAKAYCLAEKLQDITFMDCIVTALIEWSLVQDENGQSSLPSTVATNYIWANSSTNAPLRRLFLNLFIHYPQAECKPENYAFEFLVDVVKTTAEACPEFGGEAI